MTRHADKLAWVAVALTIAAWIFVPKLLWAYPVVFPSVPSIVTTTLPPIADPAPDDTDWARDG